MNWSHPISSFRQSSAERSGDTFNASTFKAGTRDESDDRLAEATKAIEHLATSPDPEVANALVVDVFEPLEIEGEELTAFVARLGPAAREVYERWISLPGGAPS